MSEYGRRARPSLLSAEWRATASDLHPANTLTEAIEKLHHEIESDEVLRNTPMGRLMFHLTAVHTLSGHDDQQSCSTAIKDLKEARDLISETITALETTPTASKTFDPRPGQ